MLCKQPFNGYGCGQCTPCLINVRRIWSSRIMLEASLYKSASFLTLTYDPLKVHKLPDGKFNLNFVHLQKFWKNFRIRLDRWNEKNGLDKLSIRYFAVGEYGHEGNGFIDSSGEQWNPHFHAALFGYDCAGKILRPETGPLCYCDRCKFVSEVWPYGNVTLDELNDTTASYIAGYTVKKMTCRDDLRLSGRTPEGSRMSQGIARGVVPDIVNALKSEFGHLAFQLEDVPVSLNRGASSIPLGRYLRRKIRQELGMEKINRETGEISYGPSEKTLALLAEKETPELSALQTRIKNLPIGSPEKLGLYDQLDSVRKRDASTRSQRILNLEAKHKINQSRGAKKL